MTGPARAVAVALAAVVGGVTAVAFSPHADRSQVPDDEQVVAAAVGYVEAYVDAFTDLLADETYYQEVTIDGLELPASRELTGELFLAWLPADRRWIAVRDVAFVDGRPVADRDDLRALLLTGPVRSVAAAVAARNARYNLGRVRRNFNEPTLALQILEGGRHAQSRFSRERVTRPAVGQPVVTLAFRERDRPTLVSSVRGGPVFSSGTIDVEAVTGRVHRTLIRFEDGPVAADLETTYRYDAGVDRWVPAVFEERYRLHDDGRGQTIRGHARYDNYRQFRVSGRMLPPGEGG